MSEELKYCKFCDKEKPIKEFCKSGGAIKNICRECQNKKQKKQYRDAKILTELEEWLKDEYKKYSDNFISNIVDEEYSYFDSELTDFDRTATIIDIVKKMDKETLDKIQELKEKYK